MRKRKIISVAAAVMMAAVTLAPQLPSAFSDVFICTPITAEAAKNEVRIKVVDMATDMPIDNVNVAASDVKDFSSGDSRFSWNTSDVVDFPIEGAYNNDWYVKLYNVPEEYNYNSVYTIDRDTRTFGSYTIRLVKKSQEKNVTIFSAHDELEPKAVLKTAGMEVYDKKGSWFCTVNCNESTYLPDGEYEVKFKEDVLTKAGICVNGEASQKLTVKDGMPTDTNYFYLASDEEKEPNVFFTIKNDGEETASSEGIGKVVITGEGFTLETDGKAYLGDGHYIAHRYNFPKKGFGLTGNEERDRHNADIIADSLLNRVDDIEFNVVDGKPDSDLVFVKVPVNKPEEERMGSTAKIKVVDKATGQNIEGVDVDFIMALNGTSELMTSWNTSEEPEKVINNLFDDSDFYYGVRLKNVPEKYNYEDTYAFTFGKNDTTEEWTISLAAKDAPAEEKGDIGFRLYSRYKGLWDREDNAMVGCVTITDGADKVVGKYSLDKMISLPDGKYKAEIEVNSKGYGCFSEQVIQFTVDEGKAVEKLDFNVERWDFKENGSGDANGDGNVDISDAVLIMQSQANPSKYGTNGTDKGHLTEDGSKRADVDGGGVTNKDALTIQQYLLGMFRFE